MSDTPDNKSYGIIQAIVLAVIFLVVHYLIKFGVVEQFIPDSASNWTGYLPLLDRLSQSLFAIMIILLAGRVLERLIDHSHNPPGIRYNLTRLTRLVTYVLIGIVGISFLFQNLFAAAVSFGIISLVLGFALQVPITSFIAWLYIIFRHPYHVGDRIQLGKLRGEVLEIGYLDTRLREFNGIYLGNDHYSGRIVHFPNSQVLKSEIVNYSGAFKPFIWNETAIQVAFTSDLSTVEKALIKAADDDFQANYPDGGGQKGPTAKVYFRVNERAWLEVVVSYLAEPTDLTGRRNRILRAAIPALNAEPDKVQFPQGTQR